MAGPARRRPDNVEMTDFGKQDTFSMIILVTSSDRRILIICVVYSGHGLVARMSLFESAVNKAETADKYGILNVAECASSNLSNSLDLRILAS